MKASLLQQLVIEFPIISKRYLTDSASQYTYKFNKSSNQSKARSILSRINKFGKKADSFAHEVREHVRLGPKITDAVKGKLRWGARILQVGGVEKIFMQKFKVKEGEKLLKASQCYLSTTSGPIAGLLFISTEKVAFCSDRSIRITSPDGQVIGRVHYKVIFTQILDDFDFWFMGFLNYQKTFKYLQHVLSQS